MFTDSLCHKNHEGARGQRDGRRFEAGRFACGCSVREAEPNHPCHQPNAAPPRSNKTRALASASFNAKRKTRRATKRNTTMTTKMISAVMIVVIILGAQASCLRLACIRAAAVTHPLTQVVLTAYCFLYFARTV